MIEDPFCQHACSKHPNCTCGHGAEARRAGRPLEPLLPGETRSEYLDRLAGTPTVTNTMIRAGREASRKHGTGAMREIYCAMVAAKAEVTSDGD